MASSAPDMTVYQAEWCPFSALLRQRLTELGVTWLAVPVDAYREDRDDMREATGSDSIPAVVLQDGTVLAGDTQEIIAELDKRYAEPEGAEDHRRQAAVH